MSEENETIHHRIEELAEIKETARRGPDPAATERQHARGKLTAYERIGLLLDKGTFTEVEPLRRHRATGFGLEDRKPYTDGVVTGWG
ncbi:carboxyl transferase domain-containing protein, partial [Streptomyces barkulensis]|uniref:carboxyl transferase domain-containing protein n=1 Tax=Streptomyces barkulensis TaxID=1257026 RepID=UPI002409270F